MASRSSWKSPPHRRAEPGCSGPARTQVERCGVDRCRGIGAGADRPTCCFSSFALARRCGAGGCWGLSRSGDRICDRICDRRRGRRRREKVGQAGQGLADRIPICPRKARRAKLRSLAAPRRAGPILGRLSWWRGQICRGRAGCDRSPNSLTHPSETFVTTAFGG
jgi:hypothetical protein